MTQPALSWIDEFFGGDAPSIDVPGTGTLNDVVSTDGSAPARAAGTIRCTGVAPTVTGLATGTSGRRLFVTAIGGPLVLANESASSVVANRIVTGTGADVTLAQGASAILTYDASSQRWRLTSSAGGGGGSSSLGKTVRAMADADQTLTDAEGRKGLVQTTGALTAKRKLTFAVPAADTSSYTTPILNTCSFASIVVSVGTGNTVDIEPGAKALVQITASGVAILVDLPLDPRDFGCPWDGVNDDLPGLQAMLAAIPATRQRSTRVELPKGQGYCSDFWRINRNVDISGHGRVYAAASAVQNGLRFPPLRGVIFDGHFTSADYPDASADHARLRDASITSRQAVVTDAGGNIGNGAYFLDTTVDIWSALAASVALGTVTLRSGAPVGSIQDYYNDGAARSTAHLVMFRCTTAGTKGSAEPAAFATSGVANIGTTIAATAGTAVWTVEAIPKDYVNQKAYLAGERVFIPGDNDHVFEVVTAGTSCGWSTTVAAGSNGAALPQATINVADASTFPAAGTARVATASGFAIVAYTGKTGTTLTGCTGGTGTMATGGAVTATFNYAPWGVGARVPPGTVAPSYRAFFYDRSTAITAASDAAVLPQATINVTDTTDFAPSGTIQVWTGAAYVAVAYTGKTATTFTGCTGGAGTINTNGAVGQGIFWKHIPSAAITILANWVAVEGCAIFGATGNTVWITGNVDPSVAHGYVFPGGSNFWAVRDCIFGFSGSGLTTNSNNTNGGESANIQHIFLGGGRTNVDEAAYLNFTAGRFGNAASGVKDRTQGNNKHRNHYVQFSGGQPYRNDLFTGAVPGGNFSQWDYIPAETTLLPILYSPATVTGATHGMSPLSSATVLDGGQSMNIRGASPLVSNPAKSLHATIGPQNNGAASCFNFSHSDDSYEMGITASDDMTGYPAKWFSLGKTNGSSFFTEQLFLFPRPGAGALWPSGASTGALMPLWVNQDRLWIGASRSDDPGSIGFGTAAPTTGYFVRGSVVWNRNVAYNLPQGWRCIATGTPGAWVPMDVLHTPSTVPFTYNLSLWFPAPFAGVPWQGQSSAGASGTFSMVAYGGGGPTIGAALNGFATADFAGTSLYVDAAAAWTVGSGGGTIIVLTKPSTTAAAASAGYDEPSVFADANAAAALTFTTSGFGAMQSYAGGRKIVRELTPSAANAWHSAMVRWDDATALGLTVDSGAERTTPIGASAGAAVRKLAGQNYSGSALYDGLVAEILVLPFRASDAEYAAIKAYFNSTYGLAL
jgi:hypothetical protein